MSRTYLSDDVTIDTSERFDEALSELVVAALSEGVDVRGSFLCRVDGTYAWEVELVELAPEARLDADEGGTNAD